MAKFKLALASPTPGKHFVNLDLVLHDSETSNMHFMIEEFIGHEVPYGSLFAYLFRRFGYPNGGWDDYKQLVNYQLSTPMKDMVLCVTPSPSTWSQLQFSFAVPYELAHEINMYDRADRRAHHERMLDWIEANGEIPDWMPQLIEMCKKMKSDATWRDAFNFCSYYAVSQDEEKGKFYAWYKDVTERFYAIEPVPPLKRNTLNWEDLDEADPLKNCIRAAKATLEDLKRPVGVRDLAINAFGEVENPRACLPGAPAAGYPSGALGNQAPAEFADLQSKILELGKGNAKRGIAKAMAMLDPAPKPSPQKAKP